MSDPLDLPLDQTERERLGLGREVTSNYRIRINLTSA